MVAHQGAQVRIGVSPVCGELSSLCGLPPGLPLRSRLPLNVAEETIDRKGMHSHHKYIMNEEDKKTEMIDFFEGLSQ
jgi:hypothetical protein